jgi:hypothetical protein
MINQQEFQLIFFTIRNALVSFHSNSSLSLSLSVTYHNFTHDLVNVFTL